MRLRVPLAEAVYRPHTLPDDAAQYPRDAVGLGWEERLRTRARRRTDAGVEFATTLPRGTVLRDGDCLLVRELPMVVIVREQPDDVFVVRPRSVEAWALWSYHIGNSHQPMMITLDALVCPDLPGVEQMLAYHAIPFVRETRPFTPVSQSPGHHEGV